MCDNTLSITIKYKYIYTFNIHKCAYTLYPTGFRLWQHSLHNSHTTMYTHIFNLLICAYTLHPIGFRLWQHSLHNSKIYIYMHTFNVHICAYTIYPIGFRSWQHPYNRHTSIHTHILNSHGVHTHNTPLTFVRDNTLITDIYLYIHLHSIHTVCIHTIPHWLSFVTAPSS